MMHNRAYRHGFASSAPGRSQQQQNSGDRVIRSEVWNCFDLDGLMAICRACNERLKVGPTRQTSSLWRHLKRHSRQEQSQLLRPRHQQQLLMNQQRQQQRSAVGERAIQNGGFQQARGERAINSNKNSSLYYGGGGGSSTTTRSGMAEMGEEMAPLVTVNCKPVENLELDRLLGIHQQRPSTMPPMLEMMGMGGEGEEAMEGGEGLVPHQQQGEEELEPMLDEPIHHSEGQAIEAIAEPHLQQTQQQFDANLVEFLLENALSFHRVLQQSPSLGRLLRLTNSAQQQRRHLTLPQPDSLLTKIVPTLFYQALNERKAQFEEDFFVLVLRRTRVEGSAPKGTWILRISAVKLGDGFALCSRCLGVFAFRGGLDRMRLALQRCFELGQVQLKLWQVSAVVHDGSAELVELCRQLDLPSIPSAHSLLRNIYAELDKLEFDADCVRRVKARFEKAIADSLDGLNFSAFSTVVPLLVTRIDAFFRQSVKTEKADTPQSSPELRLLDKFSTLWTFQRERLLADPVARMSIFLNPMACCYQQRQNSNDVGNPPTSPTSLFSPEQWAQCEAAVVEEISQACLPPQPANGTAEMGDGAEEQQLLERRADIEAEVSNFVESAAVSENRRKRRATTPTKGEAVGANGDAQQQQQQQSLSELLFWWRVNLERFPHVGQLARQFCAIPLSVEMGGNNSNSWKSGKSDSAGSGGDIDQRNAAYASELLKEDLLPGRGGGSNGTEEDEAAIGTALTQLLTVRMAVLEKNGCAAFSH